MAETEIFIKEKVLLSSKRKLGKIYTNIIQYADTTENSKFLILLILSIGTAAFFIVKIF